MPKHDLGTVALRIFTAREQRMVEIETDGGRITDLLNAAGLLRLRGAAAEEGLSPRDGAWTTIDLDQLLVVVPPYRATDRARRLHRPPQEVRLRVGPYLVIGAAHLPPGVRPTAFLMRHPRRFLPLTRVMIRHVDGGPEETSVPVAIVNLEVSESLREAGGRE